MTHLTQCAQCGDLFEATRVDARFCTSACRGTSWRSAREAEADTLRRIGAELLARLTTAVQTGAPEAELDAIIAEAHRVLPAA
ncbi:hypothetical protein [Leifsonia sp. NPDC058248]|uniref:hypothetical protein n=1 Tax=Leifsonia sp. NPDC058248 TaxID=3346402 RepID=UPI0036DA1A6C